MHTYVSFHSDKNRIHIVISNEKYRHGGKLQDNFTRLCVLYLDQTISVHVILPGFLE